MYMYKKLFFSLLFSELINSVPWVNHNKKKTSKQTDRQINRQTNEYGEKHILFPFQNTRALLLGRKTASPGFDWRVGQPSYAIINIFIIFFPSPSSSQIIFPASHSFSSNNDSNKQKKNPLKITEFDLYWLAIPKQDRVSLYCILVGLGFTV